MARNIGAVVVFGLLLCITTANGDRIKVGGNAGWTSNAMNYTDWASTQHFYVGDWLYFVYDRHYFNVLEVNRTNYETCNDGAFITNISRGAGRDVFELKEKRPYYFISSGGFCWNQMKMAIDVELHPPPPAPSPSQANNRSPMISPLSFALSVVLAVAFMFL